jgi:putative ABC transport system permease protein
MLVNEAAALKYWPGEDAVGQRAILNNQEYTVVGIVANVRHLGPEQPVRQECYLPLAREGALGMTLVLRTAGDPMAVLPAVKSAIWSVNRNQRLSSDTVTLAGYMDHLIAQRRFNMAVLGLFGVLGVVIAAVGMYGVMAYIVSQRTSEIGLRMALGAGRGRIAGMVMRRASVLMGTGLAAGGIIAWVASARLAPFLFEIEPTDATVFGVAFVVLTATGVVASVAPTLRAASIDPLLALKRE